MRADRQLSLFPPSFGVYISAALAPSHRAKLIEVLDNGTMKHEIGCAVSFNEMYGTLASGTGRRQDIVIRGNNERIYTRANRQRTRTLIHNPTCVCCGRVGNVWMGVKTNASEDNIHYALNLYSVTNDEVVLMNIDHILCASLGGRDAQHNYQTMCQKCNTNKGDTMTLAEVQHIAERPHEFFKEWVLPEVAAAIVECKRILAISNDKTERKVATKRLKCARAHLQPTLKKLPQDALAIISPSKYAAIAATTSEKGAQQCSSSSKKPSTAITMFSKLYLWCSQITVMLSSVPLPR